MLASCDGDELPGLAVVGVVESWFVAERRSCPDELLPVDIVMRDGDVD